MHSARFASGDDAAVRTRSSSVQFASADNVHMCKSRALYKRPEQDADDVCADPTNIRGVATHREQDRLPGTHQHLSPLASPVVPTSADIGSLDTGVFPRTESPTALTYIDPFDEVTQAPSSERNGSRFNLRPFGGRQRSSSPRGHLPHPAGPADMEREESRGLVSGPGQRRDSIDSGRGNEDDGDEGMYSEARLQKYDSRDVL